jgi:hypothetical protein
MNKISTDAYPFLGTRMVIIIIVLFIFAAPYVAICMAISGTVFGYEVDNVFAISKRTPDALFKCCGGNGKPTYLAQNLRRLKIMVLGRQKWSTS